MASLDDSTAKTIPLFREAERFMAIALAPYALKPLTIAILITIYPAFCPNIATWR
jgi:hypothetical protein